MTKFVIQKPTNPDFKYPLNPQFGAIHTPLTLECDISFSSPNASEVKILSKDNIELDIFCSSLHYGQSIFEGLKAYQTADGKVAIFRLQDHMERFRRSAEIMCMPVPTLDFLMDCMSKYVEEMKAYIPQEKDHALYLRPLLFANDPLMKVSSSECYKFMVMSLSLIHI